jgi:hypothetical protein
LAFISTSDLKQFGEMGIGDREVEVSGKTTRTGIKRRKKGGWRGRLKGWRGGRQDGGGR